MKRLSLLLLSLCAVPALALEDPPRTTSTTWEIYLVVLLVFVCGFAWVYFQQKKQKERDEKKQNAERKSGNV